MSGIPASTNRYRCPRCSHEWEGEGIAGETGYCIECCTGYYIPYRTEEAPLFRNHYKCWRCGSRWSDEWTCGCDDECPECAARDCTPLRCVPLNRAARKLAAETGGA